jgi:hypothetical protein
MLEALQHERNHSRKDSWLQHWSTLTDNQSQGFFLVMLMDRYDRGDLEAKEVLNELISQWIAK